MTLCRANLVCSIHRPRGAWWRRAAIAIWSIAASGSAAGGASSDESSWTWTPQPVAIAVETDGDPALSPGLVRAVRESIQREVQAKFGAAWKTRMAEQFDTTPDTAARSPVPA